MRLLKRFYHKKYREKGLLKRLFCQKTI